MLSLRRPPTTTAVRCLAVSPYRCLALSLSRCICPAVPVSPPVSLASSALPDPPRPALLAAGAPCPPQYPHEEEILFKPLTGLEVSSTRVSGGVQKLCELHDVLQNKIYRLEPIENIILVQG